MRAKFRPRAIALLTVLSVGIAACGSDAEVADDTTTDTTTDTDTEATTEDTAAGGAVDSDDVDEALAAPAETDPPADDADDTADDPAESEEPEVAEPQTIEELEAVWAANRQVVIDDIIENGYGINEENVLIGPAGMAVDLNDCPADWSDTEGLEGRILIGKGTPLSGPAASAGNISVGMGLYFDYVSDNGGINGLPIELLLKDDSYVATQTIELVDEMLQSDKPFAIGSIGTPTALAVYDTLNDNCVPHPFAISGHPAWGDPVNHPWTTGFPLSYGTEAILWGAWMKANLADELPVTVAALVQDNDFGRAYEKGIEDYAAANPDVISDTTFLRVDPAAPTVTSEMTTINSEDPDVFISMTSGAQCLLAVEEAGRSGLNESASALFMPSICKDPNAYMIPAGDAGNGWLIVGGGVKTTTDPQYVDDPYISFVNDTIDAAGEDSSIGLLGNGFSQIGWPIVESLRIAAELPGGLSRTNFLLAQRAMELEHPILLDGITFAMNGNEDAYPIEGSEIARYDSATSSWVQEGNIVDLNGSSPNCAWDDGNCG